MTTLRNQYVTPLERAVEEVVGPRITSDVFPEIFDLTRPALARKYGLVAAFSTDVNALAAVGNVLYAFTLDSGQANMRAVNLLTSPLAYSETIELTGITTRIRAAAVAPDGSFMLATTTRIYKVRISADRDASVTNLAAIPSGGIDSLVTLGQRMFAFARTTGKLWDFDFSDGSTDAERDYPSNIDADNAGKAAFVFNNLVYHAGNDGIVWRIRDIYNDPIATEAYVTTLPVTDNPQGAAVTDDGHAYMVLGNRNLYRINPRTGAVTSQYPDAVHPAYAYIAAGLNSLTYPTGLGREADRVSAVRNAVAINRLRGTKGAIDRFAMQMGFSYTHTITARTATANPKVNFTITYPGVSILPSAARAAWLVWVRRRLTELLPMYYDLGTVNASA